MVMATRKTDGCERLARALEGKTIGDWRFSYEYPGLFHWSHKSGKLDGFATPDYTDKGITDLDMSTPDGRQLGGDSVPFSCTGPIKSQVDRYMKAITPFLKKHER
jgi:hypothetical protein